jgi:hypothetical protein
MFVLSVALYAFRPISNGHVCQLAVRVTPLLARLLFAPASPDLEARRVRTDAFVRRATRSCGVASSYSITLAAVGGPWERNCQGKAQRGHVITQHHAKTFTVITLGSWLYVGACRPPESPLLSRPQSVHVYPGLEDHRDGLELAFEYDVVFIPLLWRDWEKKAGTGTSFVEGLLDDAVRDVEGRRLAIRFQVIDKGGLGEVPDWMDPSDPSWVRRESCGKPARQLWDLNWAKPVPRQRHAAAVLALGQWVRKHQKNVAWVELGSYGFYGEWHHDGCDGLGNAEAADTPEREHVSEILDAYSCAFPRLPLTIAFDALKVDDGTADVRDPVRKKLGGLGVGLYFDALGDDDGDFTKYIDGRLAQEFPGPFGGEFKGDEPPARDADAGPCGPDDAGATYVLNERSDTCWARTVDLVRTFQFSFIRQGGANALYRAGFDSELTSRGRSRFIELTRVLAETNARPAVARRFSPLVTPRVCEGLPSLDDGGG